MDADKKDIISELEASYRDYGQRARKVRSEGRKIIGYICSLVPVEIITASGCVPFRIRGDINEPITKGDTNLEAIACPFIRSCFDLCVKGRYDFLDGSVIPHGCDSMTRTYSIWRYTLGLPYCHFINVPHNVRDRSIDFFKEELNTFRKSLGRFTGKDISDSDISEAILLHNQNRSKVKALYELRKSDPPLISGSEFYKLLSVGTSLPVTESTSFFDAVLEERKGPGGSGLQKGPRIMVDGACVDNIELVKLIEGLGANVVVDTLCNGTRDHWPNVAESGDPMEALARRYLDEVNCPRTYRENKSLTYEEDLESRFGDIGYFSKEFDVDGTILYVYRYCDPFGFEVPARKAYYEMLGVPMLHLESGYSAGTVGQFKTRIQAFLEMIG